MGSIDTTDYDKRVLAYNSLEYNLNNKQFCELFPEDVANIKVGSFSICMCHVCATVKYVFTGRAQQTSGYE